MDDNKLVLKSINQLFEYSFFIPAYQRGYRWSDTQVTQLLEDIWQFAKNPPLYEQGTEKPFYCLQPIVVKKHENNDKWEVIDGQQRLTTLYLILKNLQNQIERDQKNFTKIFYETRTDSENFLYIVETNESKEKAKTNIDFMHIWNAYNTIYKWFQNKANSTEDASPRAILAPTLLRDTKVIWYEVNETESKSIDIFTRLNIGKIPLTNAELIKAMFLQKGNFSEERATLKQIQIASEWDTIEKTLQDDAFWFFIYNPDNPLKYDNRIEYLFDLMKNRTRDSEYYHTFNEFQKDFSSLKKDNKPDIDKIWLEIKKYFLTFEEWFKDYVLFHYVGFLVDCGKHIDTIKKESENKSKVEFKDYLKGVIKKEVICQIDDLEYGDKQVKKVLLLFNIQTVLETQKSEMRFPFHKYKLDEWDIEHVRSQTEKEIKGNARIEWSKDILDYFTGFSDTAKLKGFIEELIKKKEESTDEKAVAICNQLIDWLCSEKFDDNEFSIIYNEVIKYFKESSTPESINTIANLALLDAATNRSYKNALFPIKRKRIIENDKNGLFVPIATKNLFLKYYSRKLGEVMYWNTHDAENYLEAIKETLKDFLP
ncbi:hypothetical protein EZS27_018200 [termite gut metagenome]|uniref:GmrSD restriction endonucleases N-terminal domain-containing protein n=1 Tax=termite gut metagenome TaxID=433724 RepID=A0A5J4RKQ6_9ZZZZ